MADSPTTRASLLLRLRQPEDESAWREFSEIYVPLVQAFARRRGLQDADVADLTQEVLRRVVGAIARLEYDPERGSFRGWFLTIARNELKKFFQKRPENHPELTQNLIEEVPAEDVEAEWWNREWERNLFTKAAGQIREDFQETTWQAFWRTGVEGHAPKDVATDLEMTVAAVYLAKSRVMARLKEQVQMLEGQDSRFETR